VEVPSQKADLPRNISGNSLVSGILSKNVYSWRDQRSRHRRFYSSPHGPGGERTLPTSRRRSQQVPRVLYRTLELRRPSRERPFFEFMRNLKLVIASILFQPCYRLSRYECVAAQRSDDKAGRERRQSSSRAFELSNRRALCSSALIAGRVNNRLSYEYRIREAALRESGMLPPSLDSDNTTQIQTNY
jgi:hypothetical protein